MERCRKWSLLCLIVAGVMLVGCSRKNDEASNLQHPTPTTQPNDPLSTALESGLPVLAEFGRGICIPCKMMKPVLDSVSAEFQGRAVVLTVDMPGVCYDCAHINIVDDELIVTGHVTHGED